MTVTAPFGTTEGAERRAQHIEVVEHDAPRDPALLFVIVGIVTLLAIIALGFMLTSPV